MKENSPLNDIIPGQKLINNHSARKTVVKKLKSCGVLKCEMKNISGHKSEQALTPTIRETKGNSECFQI